MDVHVFQVALVAGSFAHVHVFLIVLVAVMIIENKGALDDPIEQQKVVKICRLVSAQ